MIFENNEMVLQNFCEKSVLEMAMDLVKKIYLNKKGEIVVCFV